MNTLEPILAEFVAAGRGQPNQEFWQSFFKVHSESGGPYITGWIMKLFPCFEGWVRGQKKIVPNLRVEKVPVHDTDGMSFYSDFPSGLSIAAFVFDDSRTQQRLEFVGGFIGATQNRQTKALRPKLAGRFVARRTKNNNQ